MDFKFTNPSPLEDKKDEEITVVFSGSYEDSPENEVIYIKEGIVEIADNAFRGFKHLREIHFPKSLRLIPISQMSL